MEKFNFDVVSQTLTISAKFAKAMNNPESGEYNLAAKLTEPPRTIPPRAERGLTVTSSKT